MPRYLTFALVAPLASFGSIAVGERRGSWTRPGRSAVLGLIGACLGVEREDDAGQAALARDYGLALLCHAPGTLLADYHTAQAAPAQRNRHFATRAAELRAPDLNTILSRRDYRAGAWHLGAVWTRAAPPRWSLDDLAAAMNQPVFLPYLGRKSCPLGLPLAPCVQEADDPPAALLHRHAEGKEARLRSRVLNEGTQARTGTIVVLDADDAAEDRRTQRIEVRRDQPRSRRLWQFDLRREAVLGVDPA